MKKFVFLYNSDPIEVPNDDDTDVWMTWFDSIKESLLDMGNPFSEGMLVTSSSASAITSEMNPVSGYTVIKAEDMDAAVAIAKTCPGQSGINVYEAMDV